MKSTILKNLKQNKETGLKSKILKELCSKEVFDYTDEEFERVLAKLSKKGKISDNGKFLKYERKRKISDADDDGDDDDNQAAESAIETVKSVKKSDTANYSQPLSCSTKNVISCNMTESEVIEYRNQNSIQLFDVTEGAGTLTSFPPITQFGLLYPLLQSHCPYIVSYLNKKNFKIPSPIQAQCWPPLLEGHDVIGIAQTGYIYYFITQIDMYDKHPHLFN